MTMSDTLVRHQLETLQALFREQGFHRPATLRVLLEWAYNLSLAFGGLLGWFLLGPWWLAIAALLVSTLGMIGISTMAHTASHGAALPWRWANTFLGFFGYPFMGMVSIHYWRHKHNRVHHPNPNVIGADSDCDLMPLFAMNETEVLSAGRTQRFYYRHVQGWLFPLALTLNLFNVQRVAWTYLIAQLSDRRVRRPAHWLDLVVLFAHVGVWIVLPCLLFSPGEALLLYFLRVALLGHFMFFVFAPAHFPAEADFVDAVSAERNFIMRQIQGTVNFRIGPIGRLACNGVEFQIEHHLFPNVCHVYYRRLAPLVREFCRQNGYPYRSLGWGEAILKSYAAMFRARPIRRLAHRYEALPAPPSKILVPPSEAAARL